MKKNKKAFTLVEVLITIGIIGVVAAITIPTLLQNTNNHKFATRFKKTVSTLAQASLTSQAQYDMDYSSLSQDSNDTTCATDAIAKGNSTMCGLFNNTLAGHSYQGVYGTVKGANLSDPYTISYTTTGFNPEGNLIYALADGTLVGFKPGAKNCRLKPGNVLSSDVITSSEGLANCVGFIDVNGVQTPNKEVTCSSGTSEFSTSPCFIKSSGNAISDVFPIVFHDGTVEPATNAARAVLARGKSNIGGAGDTAAGGDNNTANPAKKTITYKDNEYELRNGNYVRELENGDLISSQGTVFSKWDDNKYCRALSTYNVDCYDSDMNRLGKNYNGQWYDYKSNGFYGLYLRKDGNNYIDLYGDVYWLGSDGRYTHSDSGVTRILDSNLNPIGAIINGDEYELIKNSYVKEEPNGDLIWRDPGSTSIAARTYVKNSDGNYEYTSSSGSITVYDRNLNGLYQIVNGVKYEENRNGYYVTDAGNGNLMTSGGWGFTKREDGLYEVNSYLYDENLITIGPKN